jgi:hypothetical protein
MITKEHILAEIRRTAIEGSPLGRKRFETATGIKESDWLGRFWRQWNDAVREAGFNPNTLQDAIPVERLLQALTSLIRELGRFPTTADLKLKARSDPDFPSHNTFNRLGPKGERAWRVLKFCASDGNLDEVATIVEPLASPPTADDADTDASQTIIVGFVYLMKSGKYYKIGRSVSAEKRAYEIQLQLPQELKLVHKIKTDDPVGIETYWHQRFADRRMRGEWFDLSREHIQTFRRRKFM